MTVITPDQSENKITTHYRPDIDGLRAIAIISVVGFHAFPSWITGGFIGVDIFFVISGYLITLKITDGLIKNTFSFFDFYSRRIRRLFPAMLLVLLASFAFGWVALFADEYKQLGKHIAGGAGFVSNFMLWSESGYFDSSTEQKPLLHLWSLSIEEQFYIFWPLLLWLIWLKRIDFVVITIIIIFVSFIFNIIGVGTNSVGAFYSPLTRFWELSVGSLLAGLTIYKRNVFAYSNIAIESLKENIYVCACVSRVLNKPRVNFQSLAGFGLIIVGLLSITKERQFPGWWVLLPVLGTALVISAGEKAWFNRVVLSHKIFVWFGLISFPLYLWHWPIFSFAHILRGEALPIELSVSLVIISILLAFLTYTFIEKPVKYIKFKPLNAVTLIVLMTIIGSIGYSSYVNDGFGFRLKENENQVKQFDWKNNNYSVECKLKYIGDDYCNITHIDKVPSAALIGDSHANHFYLGLSEYYLKREGNLINLGAGGCPPLFYIDMTGPNTSPNCYARTRLLYDFVLNSVDIKIVYIAFWHDAYFANDLIYTDKLNQLNGKNNNYLYVLNALIRTVNDLENKGKQVVLIYDMPDLKKDLKSCYLNRPINSWKPCGPERLQFINDFDRYNSLVDELKKKTSVRVFNTHQYLERNFPVDKNGIPTYRDFSHLSVNGSLFFSDKYYY